MFSALRLGSTVYVLEKGEQPILKIGQVVSVTQPTCNNNYLMSASTVDISVKVDGQTMDFKNVPSNLSTTSYNEVILTETKELMSNEVDNMLQTSKSIIDSVPYHRGVAEKCEEILKTLNPRFAKEKERDEDISNLKFKIGGLESKMDLILTILSKEETK